MSLLELDSYYTPPAAADSVLEAVEAHTVSACFDSNCGSGSLLEAAARRYPNVQCLGMDRDARVVRMLKRRHPTWSVSKADSLSDDAWHGEVAQLSQRCDLVLMNPPFSMNARKGLILEFRGMELRCSVAMAHVLTTLSKVMPQQCSAIVPESMISSQLDDMARSLLSKDYRLRVISFLKNSTFRGARANAAIINLRRRRTPVAAPAPESDVRAPDVILRGGLPVHEAIPSRFGMPYVHSTGIHAVNAGSISSLTRVEPIGRGQVNGHVILLPRVGVPNQLQVATLRTAVQLSDCVIALRFSRLAEAERMKRQLSSLQADFFALWRGTGARYITVSRLAAWLEASNISV